MALKPEPMTEIDLSAMVNQRIMNAKSYLENEIAADRSKNLRYNLGEQFGNEVEGRSQVVSMDVHDAVESLMPDIMEIMGSGAVVQYEPVGPEDEDLAKQATDYVNDIVWTSDNEGDKLTHDWCKDTLLEKNGVLKIFWDNTPRESYEELENVPLSDLVQYQEAENIEIEEAEVTGEQPVPDGMGGTEMQPLYSVKLRRVDANGRVVIDCLASEEFGIDASDKAVDDHASFLYHRHGQKTRSDWVEEGFDPEIIYSIPSDDDLINDRTRRTARARNADQQSSLTQWSSGISDSSMQRITIYECYPRMDYDGTGVAKRYVVWAGGEDGATLIPDPESEELATEVADHPFVDMTVMRQPHRWAGRALADVMRPIQEVNSTLWRQLLDNCYNINNARAGVSNKVSLEDYLNNEVAGVIEVDTEAPDVAGHIHQLSPNFIGPGIIQAMEVVEQMGKKRSGVSDSTALDPEALHKTAAGANLMLGEMHKRMLYMVKMMAITGFVPAFKKILRVIVDNQDFVRTVRLRGEWVRVDPQRWNVDYDVKPVVGLGHGTRTDRVASANALLEKQAMIVQQQGGVSGPFVTAPNISNALEMFAGNLGVNNPERFFTEVDEDWTPPPKQPDAETVKVQGELELKREKQAADAQLDREKALADAELERWKAQQEAAQKWAELEGKYQINAAELAAEIRLEKVKIATDQPGGQGELRAVNG